VAVEADRIDAMQSGCDMMQGYLFGEPQELAALRRAQKVLSAA
jgi:EAL domain-containing protein (putative c-di-GMP-specific phosphodiesterase class I)